jgi:hypothetical protein
MKKMGYIIVGFIIASIIAVIFIPDETTTSDNINVTYTNVAYEDGGMVVSGFITFDE